jgi:hypothetical protein
MCKIQQTLVLGRACMLLEKLIPIKTLCTVEVCKRHLHQIDKKRYISFILYRDSVFLPIRRVFHLDRVCKSLRHPKVND